MNDNKLRYQYFRYRLSSLASIEQDRQVRNGFFAMLRKNGALETIVEAVFEQRKNLTDEHLAYLLFAALQYLTDFEYDNLNKKQIGARLKKDLIDYKEQIIFLCNNNYLSTHVIRRYSALQIGLAAIAKKNKAVIDLGCSAGQGLMALNTDILRSVPSPDKRIIELLNTNVNLERVVGVDRSSSAQDLKWLSACIFPEIRQQRESLKQKWDYLIEHGTNTELLQIDIKEVVNINNLYKKFDIVWTSNTLYQVGNTLEESFSEIYPALDYLLAPKGVWIDAYYKKWDIDFASSDNPYQVLIYKNGDFENPLMFLKSDSDNVPSLDAGENFEECLAILKAIN